MSALERVARRIGMECKVTNLGRDYWIDPKAEGYSEGRAGIWPENLRAYLLTGDRPLRWLNARASAGDYYDIFADNAGVTAKLIERGTAKVLAVGRGSTLDAAIIALAERIEGEQK